MASKKVQRCVFILLQNEPSTAPLGRQSFLNTGRAQLIQIWLIQRSTNLK